MIRAAVLGLLAALPAAAASAEPGDVPWYAERHAERREKLRWCSQDAARRRTRECQNAEAASAVEHMNPAHPWMRGRTIFPDSDAPWEPSRAAPPPPPPPPENAPRKPVRRAT